MGHALPPSWMLTWSINVAGGCWSAGTSSPSSGSATVGSVGCQRLHSPCFPAIVSGHVMCSVWQCSAHQGSLGGCWSGEGQRKTCVLPNDHLRLLHNAAAGSCQNFRSATTHLELTTRSLQTGEVMVTPNQHIQAGTQGKILVGPACIAGVGWSFRNWVSTTVSRLRFMSQPRRSTSTRCCLPNLQIKGERIHSI